MSSRSLKLRMMNGAAESRAESGERARGCARRSRALAPIAQRWWPAGQRSCALRNQAKASKRMPSGANTMKSSARARHAELQLAQTAST